MPNNPTILFVTAGKTDLQILVRNISSGNFYRTNIEEASLRQFHQALLDDKVPYLLDEKCVVERAPKNLVKWDERNKKLEVQNDYEIVFQEDKIVLVPAKLATIIEELTKPSYTIVACVVFNTCRTNLEQYFKTEPIACGKVLSRWMAQKFGLKDSGLSDQISHGQCIWTNILDGDMDYSGPGRDFPVCREIVRRIDRIMHQFEGKKLNACLSVGGGIPKLKEQIQACADYRFGRSCVSSWEEPEYQKNRLKLCPPDEDIPTPADSFNFRGHALDLIQKGDFTGAYAAVCHLEDDPEERRWVQYIHEASDYFSGCLTREPKLAALKKITEREIRCLLAAMRAEAALWENRIPEAISLTCTFFDNALLDFIEKKEDATVDPLSKTVSYNSGPKPTQELIDKKLLTPKRGGNYGYDLMGKYREWIPLIDCNGYLERFNDALRNQKMDINPYDYRNLNTHAIIQPHDLEKAVEAFVEAKLWASEPNQDQPGSYFLGMKLVRDILKYFGIPNPQQCYCELLEQLKQELSNYEIQ